MKRALARAALGRAVLAGIVLVAAVLTACASSAPPQVLRTTARFGQAVALPAPDTRGTMPLESVIENRRSQRDYAATPLPLAIMGQLLWAGQGITDAQGRRAAPSAGGLYPLELYVVTADRTLHYLPVGHRVETRPEADLRAQLEAAALDQPAVGTAPAVFVITSVTSRTAAKYGARATEYVELEAGHVAQNVLLEATALGLAAVPIGGFNPARVGVVLALPPDEDVRYLIPVGYPAG